MRSISRRTSTDQSSIKRSALRRWLDRLGGRDNRSTKRGRLLLESLESRQLLAGDVELLFTEGVETVDDSQAAQTTAAVQTTSGAEGELTPDLVEFAKALSAAGVTYFGAAWCPACTAQKELFQDGAHSLPFVEVTGPDRSLNQIGTDEGIEEFPTWEFPDGTRETGVLSLQTLSDRSGVAIPQSETPRFQELGNQTVRIGSPLHVPIDVYDPDGGVQTVTVSIDNPDLVTAEVLSGNRSIRIDMQGYEDMVFELFEQRAPAASGRVIELAEADFYDNVSFHRIINNFMIQGGDPTGTGTSGSTLGTFDDDFHVELQHNRSGVLSFAKTTDDTNNSQFFITEVPTRHLDFNHSVFGQLVEGEESREAISNHLTNSSGQPSQAIRIETIDVFNDFENSVVMLKPTGDATGSTNVTFTVTDTDGNSYSETVQVDIVADSVSGNGQPFLNATSVPTSSPINTPVNVQLSSTDVEGDAVTYFGSLESGNATAIVNPTTGLLTVTPATGFIGQVLVEVGVRPGPGVSGNASSDQDTSLLRFNFEGEQVDTPSSLDLLTGSDSGSSNIDNVTNLGSLTFSVGGVTDGATVEITLVSTGAVLGFGTASGGSATITTNNIAALGDGSYQIAARQTLNGETSDVSAPITIVYDSEGPASVVGSAATRANYNVEYRSDLISTEEGSGLSYKIVSGPSGAAIESATGLITWTPRLTQLGQNTFTIELTDLAGNTRTESFNVEAAQSPNVAIELQLTDLNGNEISTVQVGQEFLLNFIGVDTRDSSDREGVFAAFADVLFDSTLVRPVPGAVIDYASDFPAIQSGTFLTGQIDELGAATSSTVASNDPQNLIATVRLEAIAAGSLNFRSEPADARISEMLLYGVDEEIRDQFVEYRSVSLAIGQTFVVDDDEFSIAEDSGSTTFNVLANDDVVQGSATLSVVSVTPPTSGATVELQGGEVVFTPAQDFNGDVVFTYRVRDTSGAEEDGTVTVTVTPVNDPPTGKADRFDVDENAVATPLDVLANDSSAPDSSDTFTIVGVDNQTAGATVTIEPGGQLIRYTPPTDFTGTDSFTYTLSDGEFEREVEVTLTVAPADPPPTAVDDAYDVNEDATEAEFDVLANDERDESDEAFVLESARANQGGSVRISQDGTQFFYTPAANFFGTEEVLYTIRDSGGGIATATATFTVAASEDPPPVSNPTVRVNRGSSEKVILTVGDLPTNVDGDGETLTFSDLGTPTAGGSVRIDANGDILYTPSSNTFVGTETVTYVVNDGSDVTSSGTITIDVTDLIPRNIILSAALENLPIIDGIKLVGTNALGESVDVSLLYSNGSAPRFDSVLPGEYSIEIPAIPFLMNTQEAQSIPITAEVDDGDTTITPDFGRLRPEYISIRDWLGSASRFSILVAIAPGSDSVLSNPTPSAKVKTITNPTVNLNGDDSFSIVGEAPSGGMIESEEQIPATESDRRVQKRGESAGLQLFKISVQDVTFVPQTVASSGPEAEQIVAATSNLTVSGGGPEGELIAEPSPEDLREEKSLETSVDAAMQDVAEQLTVISPSAEALADASDNQSGLDSLAVDAALSEQL